ncbi:MAG TPA: ABC transporter substrate-binding protein [Propionibacteriaceae bacterium]|nr:ABC transporter substrate-binding protein [Propionibacteriaceae bacterium]
MTACSGQVGTTQNKTDTGGSTSSNSAGTDAMIATLTLPAEVADNVAGIENYNPFAPNKTSGNYFYEPLMIRSSMNCEVVPWLATESVWEGATKITFTIRDGVKWADGQPLTAEDVAFTLNLKKEYAAIDDIGLWTDSFGAKAKSVTVDGNKVIIEFTGNAAAKYDSLITAKILPKHVWESVGDPVKYIEKKPVGTGPFAVKSYNGRKLVLERRPEYWQADKVKVSSLVIEGNYDATNAALKLSSGALDAYWGEIPNPAVSFQAKNPSLNHFWYAPAGSTVLTPNTSKAPFNDDAFRAAYSQGIDKEQLSAKATYGVMKPASQTGLKLPYAKTLLPDKYANDEAVLPLDLAKANQMLDDAGYKVGDNDVRTNKDGSPLKVEFTVQAGWIDYQAAADVIVRNLKDMKLDALVVTSPPEAVDLKKKQGDFDMMLEYLHGGCEVARNLGSKLSSDQIPTKTTVFSNVERWNDPATDEIVKKLSGSTDPAEQKELVGQLVETMMTRYPVTPLFYAPARMIYRTDKAVGWPSEENPYATNSEMLLIMTKLKSAK